MFPLPEVVRELDPKKVSRRIGWFAMLIGLALIAAAVAVISKWPESPVSEPGNDGRSAGVVESPPSIEIPWDDGVDQSLQELSSEVELLFEQSSHQAPP